MFHLFFLPDSSKAKRRPLLAETPPARQISLMPVLEDEVKQNAGKNIEKNERFDACLHR